MYGFSVAPSTVQDICPTGPQRNSQPFQLRFEVQQLILGPEVLQRFAAAGRNTLWLGSIPPSPRRSVREANRTVRCWTTIPSVDVSGPKNGDPLTRASDYLDVVAFMNRMLKPDPKFQTTLAIHKNHCRCMSQSTELLKNPEDAPHVPSRETVGAILNRLNYPDSSGIERPIPKKDSSETDAGSSRMSKKDAKRRSKTINA